ncbi:MAG: nitroreductase family protein, partial [Chthoniobacterales bacterium]
MAQPHFIPAPQLAAASDEEIIRRAIDFHTRMQRRRTIREFSDRPISREVVEHCIRTAGTAPNGANLQPWHFVAVSNPGVKR